MSEEEIKQVIEKLKGEVLQSQKNAKVFEDENDTKTFMYYQGAAMAYGVSKNMLSNALLAKSEPVKPVKPVEGVRWVKASGRTSGHYQRVCCRIAGQIDFWFTAYYDAAVKRYVKIDNQQWRWPNNEIEWLEENLPPVPVKDVPVEDKREKPSVCFAEQKGDGEYCIFPSCHCGLNNLKDVPVQSEVEEAAKEYTNRLWRGYYGPALWNCFEAGAEWQSKKENVNDVGGEIKYEHIPTVLHRKDLIDTPWENDEYLENLPPLKPVIHQPVKPTLQSEVEEAAKAAVAISENLTPKLTASEQALFIAGFQECVKWQALQAKGVK